MRRSVVRGGAAALVLLAAGCGQEGAGSGGSAGVSVQPRPSAPVARVAGLDGTAAAEKVFTEQELLPALLGGKGSDPGVTGGFGNGKPPLKGEIMADCPTRAKGVVAELYRTRAPRVMQFADREPTGDLPDVAEQLVPMSREKASHFIAMKWSVAAACPQSTVTAVGTKSIPAETIRFTQTKVQLADEAFVQESVTWKGDSATASKTLGAGDRTYTVFLRMGGVIVIYGQFPTEAEALAGGAKAAAHARTVLLRTAGG